jgi:transcriptional regulator with XRE-family HTH domain
MTKKELKKWRDQYGFSQATAAEYLNISLSAYQKWEQGVTPVNPLIDVIVKLMRKE